MAGVEPVCETHLSANIKCFIYIDLFDIIIISCFIYINKQMTELVPSSAKDLVFDQKEILPYGKLGHFIDWNKVFRDKIGTFYPKPINWHTSLNEHGEFDTYTFLWART